MQRSGHHEFGQDRRPLNLGDSEPVQEILKAWAVGDEVRGLAIYWNMIYRYLARLLAADAGVRTASLVVPYESMCAAPEETIRRVLDHCRLSVPDHVVMAQASGICRRAYYHVEFSPRDLAIIHQETDATASMWISPGTVAAARRSQFDAQLTCSTAASNR